MLRSETGARNNRYSRIKLRPCRPGEIERSGARDLIDILNLVPGFRSVSEVHETISLGTRGVYGAEGKIQINIDGIEVNENLFGYILLGNHHPAEMIEQIEIIRGPGSAIYGGTAELGVIKIITRGAGRDLNFARTNVSLNRGKINHRESVLCARECEYSMKPKNMLHQVIRTARLRRFRHPRP